MTDPIERLRHADPAADLPRTLDERAEADLALLLAAPRAAPPHRASAPAFAPRASVLVTAVVALVVVALSAAVLGVVRPRAVSGAATGLPSISTSVCRPDLVLPFLCGTYRSTYGGAAVTGDTGGPAADPLSISFTQAGGALLLTARTEHCFGARVLVRYEHSRLVRLGRIDFNGTGCFGPGADMRSWARAFLEGPLTISGVDGPSFGKGDSSVFFAYQGAAPIGQPQLPRNDKTCVAAHIAPFGCGTYRAVGGTGSLPFLSEGQFRVAFSHENAELTLVVLGRCNDTRITMEPDGATVLARPGISTAMLCTDERGQQDMAVTRFFTGVLSYRVDGDEVTFTRGGSSATFRQG